MAQANVEGGAVRPGEPYKFTTEELRVLRECNYESFYYRSLPFGTALGAAAFYAVKAGYLKPSARFGPVPKVLLGAILGYFGGKISYQDKCVEKIMSLPDSKLAEVLRQRKGGTLPNSQDSLPRVSVPEVDSYPSAATNVQTESFNEMRSADLSFDAPPTMVGLDDSSRPSVDSIILSDEALPPPSQSTTSYEELRHRNRQNYELKKAEYYQQSSPVPSEASPVPAMSPAPKLRGDVGKKNAYGDVWEE